MIYDETAPSADLKHMIKLGWTLDVPREGPEWTEHVATPDGCMELIRRIEGRSKWGREQPETFVAGIVTQPTVLHLHRGSRFIGIRIWPWTWRALSDQSPAEMLDRWEDLSDFPQLPGLPDTISGMEAMLRPLRGPDSTFIEAVLRSRTCADLSKRSGASPRTLQRWFTRHVGLPPRLWLRLLRFSDAFAGLPLAETSLAEHALDHGYADQAHMAREFKLLAGTQARQARSQGRGPFLTAKGNGG